jgi:hypothetical protein
LLPLTYRTLSVDVVGDLSELMPYSMPISRSFCCRVASSARRTDCRRLERVSGLLALLPVVRRWLRPEPAVRGGELGPGAAFELALASTAGGGGGIIMAADR